jgi:hypothetical protein
MSKVRCTTCGKTKAVDFGACLASGWPKCCGYTMRLEDSPSPEQIDSAVKNIVAPAVNWRQRWEWQQRQKRAAR